MNKEKFWNTVREISQELGWRSRTLNHYKWLNKFPHKHRDVFVKKASSMGLTLSHDDFNKHCVTE